MIKGLEHLHRGKAEETRSFLPKEENVELEGAHHRFSVLKRVTEKGKKGNLFTRNHARNRRHQVQLALCDLKKKFFTVKRIDHWEQPPQGHRGILITEGFQDMTGHSGKETFLGSLVH